MKRFRNPRGFTLLELLLAMGLFAIVSIGSYNVFKMGIQIWRRTQGATQVERKALLGLEKMGRDIRQIIQTKDERLIGEGKAGFFRFPGQISALDKDKGLLYSKGFISYEWDRAKGAFCVRKRSLWEIEEDKRSACQPLVDHVKKIKFEYWLAKGFTGSYAWYDAWAGKDGLPQAVKIKMITEVKRKGQQLSARREYERTVVIPVAGFTEEEGLGA